MLWSLAGAAGAADGDWRQARADDFKHTPHAAERGTLPGSALSATGDFDGNGLRDAARLMVSPKAGVFAVVLNLRTPGGDARMLLVAAPLAQLGPVGLSKARRDGRDELVIFTFDGAKAFVRLERGRIEVRWD
jgi:hypothetical protein